jgi:AraC-like DNA-binding protein
MFGLSENATERLIGAEFDLLRARAADDVGVRSFRHGGSVCMHHHLGEARGDGWERRWAFGEDLFALVVDRPFSEERCVNYVGENLLKVHLRYSGASTICVPGGQEQLVSGPYCGVMIHPLGLEKYEWTPSNQNDRWVTVFCRPTLFTDGLGLDSTDLPDAVARFVRGDEAPVELQQLPAGKPFLELANVLFNPHAQDSVARLSAEARMIELVSATLTELQLLPSRKTTGIRISPRDLKAIEQARDILVQNLADPPSLTTLARMVGVNRNKLNAGFRQRFDASVGAYLNAARMVRARELLEQAGLSVTETAFEVGYEFPSNFSTAFKRHFGYAPKHRRAG